MPNELTSYLISEFETGLTTYLKPWMRPKDSFEPLVNAYTYRGVLNKRNGSVVFGNQLADTNPVMGIMNRIDESTSAISLVVASTTNAYLYDAGGNVFNALTAVGGSASIFWKGTATGTLVMPTFWPHWSPTTVTITDGTTTVSFNGGGTMTGAGGIFSSGSINYTTGVVTITFSGSTAGVSLKVAGTLAGAYFTGNISNFFNWTNWQPTDPTTFTSSVSYLYMTNNIDPVTLFDGTNLSRPILYVVSNFSDYITTCLDIAVYQNRLLLLRPTLNSTSNSLNQSIYFSALFNPLNFINDVAGNGGQQTAATGDILQSQEFLRNQMIVFFTTSVWLFRFTGSASDPFRFDKITIAKSVSAPYASIAYDERATAIGNLGLIACDGVNVQRYDTSIIDYYETQIDENYFSQIFSQRYDNLNQTWMLYVSNDSPNEPVDGVAPGSDSALIYNFAENTWATYTFSVPMTCLGKFFSISGATWASLTQSWESTQVAWKSYTNQKLAPILLGGDTNGNVYWLDNEDAVTDQEPSSGTPGVSFLPDITTTRWNPVIKVGQKTQFAYIDIYYSISSTDPAHPIRLTLSFYVDNSNNEAFVTPLTLDGPINSEFTFKRIYCNLVGEFIQMNIDPDEDAPFQILGFIIWARPAGRMTP